MRRTRPASWPRWAMCTSTRPGWRKPRPGSGHSDLAGKAARAGTMTVDSKAEQASAGLDRLSEAEFAQFHRLNNAYREKFGMPFIICVRRHSRDSILQQFERRLQNTMS